MSEFTDKYPKHFTLEDCAAAWAYKFMNGHKVPVMNEEEKILFDKFVNEMYQVQCVIKEHNKLKEKEKT